MFRITEEKIIKAVCYFSIIYINKTFSICSLGFKYKGMNFGNKMCAFSRKNSNCNSFKS